MSASTECQDRVNIFRYCFPSNKDAMHAIIFLVVSFGSAVAFISLAGDVWPSGWTWMLGRLVAAAAIVVAWSSWMTWQSMRVDAQREASLEFVEA